MGRQDTSELLAIADVDGINAVDVGARGRSIEELQLIGSACTYYGFEPDPEECRRLRAAGTQAPWHAVHYLPVAIGADDDGFQLNIYSQAGCSSRYAVNSAVAERFGRTTYFQLEERVVVPSVTLDDLIAGEQISRPDYLKIDVQGMELEVLQGASGALDSSVVALRLEAYFVPLYHKQVLFAELDQAVRDYGFVPMRFIAPQEWRRDTRTKYPLFADGPLPFSRGQLMHADVLYMKEPERFDTTQGESIGLLVRLGLLAALHGHYDHAYAAWQKEEPNEYIHRVAGVDPLDLLSRLSRSRARPSHRALAVLDRVVRRLKARGFQ